MKLIIRVVTALVLTVVLLAGLVLLLPGEKIARLAADQLEAQTGRQLGLGGKGNIKLTAGRVFVLRLSGHGHNTRGIVSDIGRNFQGQKARCLGAGRHIVAGAVACRAAALNNKA